MHTPSSIEKNQKISNPNDSSGKPTWAGGAPQKKGPFTRLYRWLTDQPYNQFRKNRYFYPMYDAAYLVAGLATLSYFYASGWTPLFPEWKTEYLYWIPVACYAQIMCSVFIHNASHGNFPRAINRLVGELCGIAVLTRFASWQIVHVRHHAYSDDVKKDPHPVDPNYFKFCWNTIKNVEIQLQNNYFEIYGNTPENHRYEMKRAYMSYVTNIVMILCWYQLLGPIGFAAFFIPSFITGFFHLMHFNWSTHNALSKTGPYHPINIDRGFFWLGNRLWFGIYMHDNHHRHPTVFHPLYMPKHFKKAG
jgi:stearoyl-CoA desaturase (delta-9 desaturase)